MQIRLVYKSTWSPAFDIISSSCRTSIYKIVFLVIKNPLIDVSVINVGLVLKVHLLGFHIRMFYMIWCYHLFYLPYGILNLISNLLFPRQTQNSISQRTKRCTTCRTFWYESLINELLKLDLRWWRKHQSRDFCYIVVVSFIGGWNRITRRAYVTEKTS
jgi:hypothetical protein